MVVTLPVVATLVVSGRAGMVVGAWLVGVIPLPTATAPAVAVVALTRVMLLLLTALLLLAVDPSCHSPTLSLLLPDLVIFSRTLDWYTCLFLSQSGSVLNSSSVDRVTPLPLLLPPRVALLLVLLLGLLLVLVLLLLLILKSLISGAEGVEVVLIGTGSIVTAVAAVVILLLLLVVEYILFDFSTVAASLLIELTAVSAPVVVPALLLPVLIVRALTALTVPGAGEVLLECTRELVGRTGLAGDGLRDSDKEEEEDGRGGNDSGSGVVVVAEAVAVAAALGV